MLCYIFSSIFHKKGRLDIGVLGSRYVFWNDGLISAIWNDCGAYPEISELFISLSSVSLNKVSACLSSFVGIGSSRLIDLDEKIRE